MLTAFVKQLSVGQLFLHVPLQARAQAGVIRGWGPSPASSAGLALPGNSDPLVAEATAAPSH